MQAAYPNFLIQMVEWQAARYANGEDPYNWGELCTHIYNLSGWFYPVTLPPEFDPFTSGYSQRMVDLCRVDVWFLLQMQDWQSARQSNGEDSCDWPAFRVHIRQVGGFDPLDPPPDEFGLEEQTCPYSPLLCQMIADNPNFVAQGDLWRAARLAVHYDGQVWDAFREYLAGIYAPDPGPTAPPEWGAVTLNDHLCAAGYLEMPDSVTCVASCPAGYVENPPGYCSDAVWQICPIPDFLQKMAEWQAARQGNGENQYDWDALKTHLRGLGACNPGDPAPPEFAPPYVAEYSARLKQLVSQHINFLAYMLLWQLERRQNNEDAFDWPAFKSHVYQLTGWLSPADPAPVEFMGGSWLPTPPNYSARLAQILGDNPNFLIQMREWKAARLAAGQDPQDWYAFRAHLRDSYAPDPGDPPPVEWGQNSQPEPPPPPPPPAISSRLQQLIGLIPDFVTIMQAWKNQRLNAGQDAQIWFDFKVHLIATGYGDVGDPAPEEWGTVAETSYSARLQEILLQNPNFLIQMSQWKAERMIAGQDPQVWDEFREYLEAIGAPDPLDPAPVEWGEVHEPAAPCGYSARMCQILEGNPNFIDQMNGWKTARTAAGQDPQVWDEFREYLEAIGAPDPLDPAPLEWGEVHPPGPSLRLRQILAILPNFVALAQEWKAVRLTISQDPQVWFEFRVYLLSESYPDVGEPAPPEWGTVVPSTFSARLQDILLHNPFFLAQMADWKAQRLADHLDPQVWVEFVAYITGEGAPDPGEPPPEWGAVHPPDEEPRGFPAQLLALGAAILGGLMIIARRGQ